MPAHHLHAHEYSQSLFPLGKVQAGYVRHLPTTAGLVAGIGGSVALSLLPPELAPRYFGRVAPSFALFLNLRPARHEM
jgi:hypothetical protein